MGILLLPKCRHILYRAGTEEGEDGVKAGFAECFGEGCGMRHMIVATTMLVVALVVTFGAASVLQGVAMAKGPASAEPFVIVEAAKPAPARVTASKERVTPQFRERSVHMASQVGL